MDPYQPGPAAPPPGQYDFITNPVKQPKKGFLGLGGMGGKLAMVAIGLGILTVVILLGSLFLGGPNEKDTLLPVAQKQSEVIALGQLGAKDGGTSQIQALGLATQLSLTTQQQELVAQIAKSGSKVKEKDYSAKLSSQVTSQLDNAKSNGRFDDAYRAAMKQALEDYQQTLKTANSGDLGKTSKALLARDFDQATLLISVAKQ